MTANQKMIFVYDDFSTDCPVLMGKLYVNVIKGGESCSFEYDNDWLKQTGLSLTLDPELRPYSGRQYPSGRNIFGLFADASPDRWGRVLLFTRQIRAAVADNIVTVIVPVPQRNSIDVTLLFVVDADDISQRPSGLARPIHG